MNDLQNNTRKLTPQEAMLRFASQYIGLQEIVGEKDNPIIVQMFKDIGYAWVKDDETAWCACFINWCAYQVGCEMSGKLNARSFLYTGIGTDYPVPGDITVLWRESPDSWKGHVGLFVGYSKKGNLLMLGGNQKNEVNISEYSSTQLLEFRQPYYKNR